MSPDEALNFVEQHGVVLESGRGPVPNVAEAIAGETINGSWWGHKKGKEIFRLTRYLRSSPDVLVCRLVSGKITYIHRRLWPAVIRLASGLDKARTNAIREVHTSRGRHVIEEVAIECWSPEDVREAAELLSRYDAIQALPEGLME